MRQNSWLLTYHINPLHYQSNETFEYAGHVAARQTQEVAKYNDGNQDKIVLAEILESEAAAN